MAQILHGLSYIVCSTISPTFVAFGPFLLLSGVCTIIHQQPVAMLQGYMRSVHTVQNISFAKKGIILTLIQNVCCLVRNLH